MARTGVDKFKFVSPGIQVAEVDNSRLPGVRAGIGPVVIGRAARGPAMRPVTVGSFGEFVEIFGNPSPGGQGDDPWRNGIDLAPTYGMYAAQAWLRNQDSLTFVRLLGTENSDATNAGKAGWQVGSSHDGTFGSGGAFGLFIIDSGSATTGNTGSLAAIWYAKTGSIELSGTDRDGSEITGTAALIASQGTDKEFKALVKDENGNISETVSFNFNRSSRKFIRNVFNTNPTLLNTDITRTAQQKTYFLGETFEKNLETFVTGTSAGGQYGVILALKSGTIDQNDQRMAATSARTGWFISQDLGSDTGSFVAENQTQLFRFVTLDSGEWEQRNLKISILDIRPSQNDVEQYGSFTVQIRSARDNDNSPQVIETYSNVNLNPNSNNFIARRIGDKFLEWSDTERRFREFGNFDNQSRFIRVEMNPDVEAGATPAALLPFGVLGPVRFKGFSIVNSADEAKVFGANSDSDDDFAGVFAQGNADVVSSNGNASLYVNVGSNEPFTGSFVFPALQLRSSSREGVLASPTEAFFGVDSTRTSNTRFEQSFVDVIRKLPENLEEDASDPSLEYSFVFTLDDLQPLGNNDAQWVSGSRAAGNSYTAVTGTWSAPLDAGFDRFTTALHGGFDGLDITEKEPFNNRVLENQDSTTSYEFNTLKRAIDTVKDPEVVEMDHLVVPGVTDSGITDHMLNVTTERADSIAIIDLEGGFVPASENALGDSSTQNRGSVTSTISNLRTRGIDTSYGCAYYPWLQVRDTERGNLFWCPPSVVMLGVFGNTERVANAWIAPAGFTRGGLTEGSAGIPVTAVRERLDQEDRDDLYEVNINPIGKFPAEGIVVLGQKTLQARPSALDRVNVRKLLNYLKVRISRVAATILFDQNIQTTWDRFRGQADPILENVKATFGLEDYKLVLDESTTTPDLQDRNIMYAKVFLKPAKAIEFIAIDFVITNSGASFADL